MWFNSSPNITHYLGKPDFKKVIYNEVVNVWYQMLKNTLISRSLTL